MMWHALGWRCSRQGQFLRNCWKSSPNAFVRFQSVGQAGALKRDRTWIFGVGLGLGFTVWVTERIWQSQPACFSEEKPVKDSPLVGVYGVAVETSRDLLNKIKEEVGAPGIVVGVSVEGKEIWSEGLGYADVENRVPCKPSTVMRIASISKSLTMTAIARLWEEGKLDLDAPVQKYVPEFPEKEYEGEKVTITSRLLVSHLSGIRHYEKDVKKVKKDKENANKAEKQVAGDNTASSKKQQEIKNKEVLSNKNTKAEKQETCLEQPEMSSNLKNKISKAAIKKKEFELEEYYLKDKYESVIDALKLFKDDPLIFKPGTQFLYSTFAWTLLSAVVERASGQKFLDYMKKMFYELGMLRTVPEENEPIIYNRARPYIFNKNGRLVNSPYVDNSYKWAGGGFLSTVGDLLIFGNAMLYSYQVENFRKTNSKLLPGYIKQDIMREIWTPVDKTETSWLKEGKYAMGWGVVDQKQKYGHCRKQKHYISHTGGAVGASSVLLVLPKEVSSNTGNYDEESPPQGVVVAILCNMQSVGLNNVALNIALEFDKARIT
ncbi:serine beta-lactamase-like protein LACTB, mitochondrial [Protopterus annectens]|uniref:serine beta-lactamase-like protein LACTB, mitochondrial n=1 Tax=Protopterus annectens TaxID=7888 RepID=UPI001CFADE61|nr:serine beta-lactamase-like protein LACTB, mitochondrial [Protopterus annectens]